MTSGRLAEPKDAPTAAATEWPIDAHTASDRKASLPFTGRFAAAYVPRKVSGMVISVSSNAIPTRWKTWLYVSVPAAAGGTVGTAPAGTFAGGCSAALIRMASTSARISALCLGWFPIRTLPSYTATMLEYFWATSGATLWGYSPQRVTNRP